MYIYTFGSVCRGEIDQFSDVDMLVILNEIDSLSNFDPEKFSIYNEKKIKNYWSLGNPFAWHLFLESSLVYSHDKNDFIKSLGSPKPYKSGIQDMIKFKNIFNECLIELKNDNRTYLFELSTIFLCIRNFATCYSLHRKSPNFSRHSALQLGSNSIKIDSHTYNSLEKARLLATRGHGEFYPISDLQKMILKLDKINLWMNQLLGNINA